VNKTRNLDRDQVLASRQTPTPAASNPTTILTFAVKNTAEVQRTVNWY